MALDESFITAVESSGYGYFTARYQTTSNRIVKVDLNAFQRVGFITVSNALSYSFISCALVYNNTAYFGTATGPGVIIKVDLSTFQIVDNLTLPNANFLTSAILYNGVGYFSTSVDSPSKVVAVNLTSLQIGSIVNTSTSNTLDSGAFLYGGSIYYGTTYNSVGVRLDLTTSQFEYNNFYNQIDHGPILTAFEDQGYGYFINTGVGNEFNYPSTIAKYNLQSSWTQTPTTLQLNDGYAALSASSFEDNGYGYFSTSEGTPQLLKVDLEDLASVQTLTIAGYSLASFKYNNLGFFGIKATNFAVLVVNLINFTVIRNVTVSTEVGSITTAVQSNNYGYFATNAKILKIDLLNYTLVGSIAKTGAEANQRFSFIYNNFACFVSPYTGNTVITKIDLSTFQRAATVFPSVTSGTLGAMAYQGYAYIGYVGGSLVKIDLNNGTIVGSLLINNNHKSRQYYKTMEPHTWQ